ncbi:hypothetical protein C7G41_10595 [Bradyrhizobium sp. MOS002]|nr:hypothetical protein C7G41_10595 [Bradyrhizobium sp. MOS002]
MLVAASVAVSRDAQKPPHRHCEELLRRSNPDCHRGKILDCLAALAMTGMGTVCPYSGAAPTGGPPGGRCRKVSEA